MDTAGSIFIVRFHPIADVLVTRMGNAPSGRETDRIVKFTPRPPARVPLPSPDPIISREQESTEAEDADEYRHRMRMNGAAAAVVTLLIAVGLWLAGQMADFRAAQECLTMGARGACATIQVPSPGR